MSAGDPDSADVAPTASEIEESRLGRQLRSVGGELHEAIQALAARIPTKAATPRDFARTLKIHRTLASKLSNALKTDDPLAAISRLPRGEGLRMIFQAARASVPQDAIDRAEAALQTFEQIVQGELGGWDGFDAAVTEWLPEARARFELASKQMCFKGMANLFGVRADVQLDTAIYHPDADGELCDIALIEGFVGLRRLRPSVRVPIASHVPEPHSPRALQPLYEDENGEGDPARRPPLLHRFGSAPPPELNRVETGVMVNYVLAGNRIGMQSAVDLFAANIVRGGRPLYRRAGDPAIRPHWSAGVNLPARTLLMNLLMHDDVWPDCEPRLMVYDMHVRGLASPDDPNRELDRMNVIESIQPLGRGAARFRAAEVGRHVEIVQHVCARLGWDANRLRGYRVRVQYPLTNAQYCVAFDPPPLRP